jgi:outer membrane receptor protein involved in Fe transport
LVPTAFAGNPYLTPEVATTWTAGFVYRPSWVPRFSISLDGYNILIRNAITSASGSNALFQNICYASGGSSPYCLLQVRPLGYTNTSAANTVEEWYSSGVNIAQQWTYGADLEANYATTLFGRPLAIRELLDYQPHIIYEQPGVLTYDDAGAAFNSNNLTASPVLRMTAFINFSPIDNLSIGIMERWRSSLRFAPATTLVFDTPTIPSIAYTNLNVTYTLKKPGYGSTDLFVTISNLFNTPPPAAANFGANGSVGLAGGFVSGDDPIGFQYMMGVRFKY